MAAEVATNAQQSGIGMSSIRIFGAGCGVGATVTLVTGASAAGKSINGWVFFISTACFTGGSGSTVMRAVSFLGAWVVIGAGMAAAAARIGDGDSGGAGWMGGGRVASWIRIVPR